MWVIHVDRMTSEGTGRGWVTEHMPPKKGGWQGAGQCIPAGVRGLKTTSQQACYTDTCEATYAADVSNHTNAKINQREHVKI